MKKYLILLGLSATLVMIGSYTKIVSTTPNALVNPILLAGNVIGLIGLIGVLFSIFSKTKAS